MEAGGGKKGGVGERLLGGNEEEDEEGKGATGVGGREGAVFLKTRGGRLRRWKG